MAARSTWASSSRARSRRGPRSCLAAAGWFVTQGVDRRTSERGAAGRARVRRFGIVRANELSIDGVHDCGAADDRSGALLRRPDLRSARQRSMPPRTLAIAGRVDPRRRDPRQPRVPASAESGRPPRRGARGLSSETAGVHARRSASRAGLAAQFGRRPARPAPLQGGSPARERTSRRSRPAFGRRTAEEAQQQPSADSTTRRARRDRSPRSIRREPANSAGRRGRPHLWAPIAARICRGRWKKTSARPWRCFGRRDRAARVRSLRSQSLVRSAVEISRKTVEGRDRLHVPVIGWIPHQSEASLSIASPQSAVRLISFRHLPEPFDASIAAPFDLALWFGR